MTTKNHPTQERVKEILEYSPDTGAFIWKISNSNRVKVGAKAGTLMNTGYISIGIDGPQYLAHRLAFLYVNGTLPSEIDHIDHNPANNAISNLRAVSHTANGRNQKFRCTNTSGVIGVGWDKSRGAWQARIRHDNRIVHLGRFKNIEDAAKAREKAEQEYGYHPNHGSPAA
jgi:hypothetical protein